MQAHNAGKKREEGQPSLTIRSLNPAVVKAEYAVRGEIPIRSEEIRNDLAEGRGNYKFEEVVTCNIGNPQQLGQKPITWIRQIASLVEYPELIDHPLAKEIYPEDALEKARSLLQEIGNVGAYSHSKGVPAIRRRIAAFLERRDGVPADPEDIFLTTGASTGVADMLRLLIASPSDGVLIPIPQYPLYTASLALNSAHAIPYYLNEADDWSLDIASLSKTISQARSMGVTPKAMAVINPGNPTGSSLSEENIKEIIKFCFHENLVILADEVYQNNIYEPDTKPFCSFKRALSTMEAPYRNTVELVSFHSISKGQTGECGRRGGYFEIVNFDSEVKDQIYKVASISLCPPLSGQIGVDLMLNPPVEGGPSYKLWKEEVAGIHETLHDRSQKLLAAFRQLDGIECNPAEGAMYLFPTIKLPQKAVEKARQMGKPADALYCLRLLEETGICVVPGSGFGQADGTLHFRTTFLAPGTEDYVRRFKEFHENFMTEFA
ncbi:putative alanine aminotransferase [Atractiella rhizophila]|nr:putative alanine aminotransferase [Atractiella rhizophila]